MGRRREFGYAWIEIWGRVLGSQSADTFLRNGVGVNGAVYSTWAERWRTAPRGVKAVAFVMANVDAIRSDAIGATRCPECRTEKGLHAPYCKYVSRGKEDPGKSGRAEQYVAFLLEKDLAVSLLSGDLGISPLIPDFDASVAAVMTKASPQQRKLYETVIEREKALRAELAHLLKVEPSLARMNMSDPKRALETLADMLGFLIGGRGGDYARFGRDGDAPWLFLVDQFEMLPSLTDYERMRMIGCCAYIRQVGMTPTGMDELLAMDP